METWLLIFLSLSLCAVVSLLLNKKRHKKQQLLPPGPLAVPILGNLLWLRRSFVDLEPLLRDLHARYGPIVTLRIGSRPTIFISDRRLAHKVLVEHGAAFAGRPAALPVTRFLTCNQHNITSAPYGSLWRLLRRNLMSETLQSSRVKLFAPARQWVLRILIAKLRAQASEKSGGAAVMESFQFSMFCLLVLMCFGEKLDEESIRAIEAAQRNLLLYGRQLRIFSFAPAISKHLFRNRWNKAMEMQRRRKEIFLPLIRARLEQKLKEKEAEEGFVHSYVDSLLDMEIPEEGKRKLTEDEISVLSSEFLNAGTDTTSTALQWIMAELVKHQEVQAKLLEEIEKVVDTEAEEVKEEDLQRMPYNKAVVMEGLRRHPPAHFVLPHAVTEETTIEGYTIPKDATVNFLVAEMGWDEEVWEDPLEFQPERFLEGGAGEGVDITGTREIKMMPFGVGRRICPGLGLAMLHLEYFVANLVREFEWKSEDGKEVDLAEKLEFTVVMKNPLRARVIPRRNSCN